MQVVFSECIMHMTVSVVIIQVIVSVVATNKSYTHFL